MKKICFSSILIVLFLTNKSYAQPVLEKVYPPAIQKDLQLTKLTGAGTKYIFSSFKVLPGGIRIEVYNLDHSLYKSMDVQYPDTNYIINSLHFVSDQLFNQDTMLEVLYTVMAKNLHQSDSLPHKVVVQKEDLSILFQSDSSIIDAAVFKEFPSSSHNSILTTSTGPKLIIKKKVAGNLYMHMVYSLPGTLPAIVKENPTTSLPIAAAFPNPSSAKVIIPYALPTGVYSGDIVFYDLKGIEVKRFTVSPAFNTLEIDHELTEGTYLYQLQGNGIASEAKKLLVIK